MIPTPVWSQQGSYGKLMPIPERISGNFGEFRSNHFHAGIDYKTMEQTGFEVYAAADGFISRVKVSHGGYGRALYITHPELNTVTVYAHLSEFFGVLNDSIRMLQYSARSYETEIFPDSATFPVIRGQLIGYSGNAGSSEGPHLHFETRHRTSEKPFNPELAGYQIEDTIPPVVLAVVFYDPGSGSVLSTAAKQIVDLTNQPGPVYVIEDTITVDQQFFIGFEGYDKAGTEPNRLGFRAWQLTSPGQTHFSISIDSFAFDETRLINSMIDHQLQSDSARKIILCFNQKGNQLSFASKESGLISMEDGEVMPLRLLITDHSGNKTEVRMIVQCAHRKSNRFNGTKGRKISFGEEEKFKGISFELILKEQSLFDDGVAEVTYSDTTGLLSGILQVSPGWLTFHEPAEVAIKPYRDVVSDSGKVVMVLIGSGAEKLPLQGQFKNGYFRASTRNAGQFILMSDTSKPQVMEPFWFSQDIRGFRNLIVPVTDDLSGIKSVEVTIEGNWVRSEYNSRRKEVIIDERDLSGSAAGTEIGLKVTDKCNNETNSVFRLSF